MTRLHITPGRLLAAITALIHDQRGTTVIETAIVAPVLVLMALGSYDISHMVARQHELQSGASDVEGIVLAVASGTSTNVQTIKSVLTSSLELTNEQVTVVKVYRCGAATTLVTVSTSCTSGSVVSTYVRVTFIDSYSPTWTEFGVGHALAYRVVRTVQIS